MMLVVHCVYLRGYLVHPFPYLDIILPPSPTSPPQIGTALTNLLIAARKSLQPPPSPVSASLAADGSAAGLETAVSQAVEEASAKETEVPILATSLAYGVYMAVSSNLR